MLTYNFTNTGSDSLYAYLYKCIKNDILQGKLKAGEKLPSKRSFAKNLGISVITVENAYGQLMAEGYIYSFPKKGFFVSDLNHSGVQKQPVDMNKVVLTGGANAYTADFTSNQTDHHVFPFSIWTKAMREVINENQTQLMRNPPCGGIMELRQSISRYLSEFRGMQVKPEQIIIGAGTEYLYGLIIQLMGSQVVYGVENPGYPKIAKIYKSMQVACEYIDIDEEGVPAKALVEKKIDVMHLSPSHHFPTGIVMPISRRYELLGWASREKGRYIIEDDYDSELRLLGRPIPTLQSIDVSDKVIYMNTFTKTLCSTVRISYMVLPADLTEKFYQNLSFYSCTVSNFEQYTLARFMENGNFEKHINRLRNYYQNKRDEILSAFRREPLGSYLTIMEEGAGVHFLMHVDCEKEEDEIVREARAKGIKLMPLSKYYYGNEVKYPNTYVMNYSSIETEKLKKAVTALGQIIRGVKESKK
ncbi:MAG: PLP-dependent aminotransferase family protein [Lachnospiraceae bacterium]|nr:PLP-dependent aminotransferase family protein [Lachnospiraceae bacterium]